MPPVPSLKVQLGWQFRDAWLPPHSVSALELEIDDAATHMQIGIGVLAADPALLWDEMQFDVVLTLPGVAQRRLFSQGVTARESARNGWFDADLELPPGSGRRVRFEAAPTHPRPREPEGLQPLWARPRLTANRMAARARRPTRPNIVLISIDTLRADHVGAYGYGRPTTPAIDRLAREGMRFATAIAPSSWTTPSHMSLLTSLLPATHGIEDRPDDIGDDPKPVFHALADAHTTLAEVLHGAGYETAAFTGGDTLAGRFGFARGFERYDEGLGQLTPCSWQPLENWLSLDHAAPFFLFVHTFEVHAPYTATRFRSDACRAACPPDDQARQQNIALYDGDIRTADDYVERLVARLRSAGLWERTLVVLTSDHGEEFGDHDSAAIDDAHGHTLYDELLRVPLVFAGGETRHVRGRVVPGFVRLIDVAPTILEIARVEVPPDFAGRSLRPLFEPDSRPTTPPPAVSELRLADRDLRSLRGQRWKYLQYAARPSRGEAPRQALEAPLHEELYDLVNDPGEKHDLCASHADECGEQRRALLEQILAARALRRSQPQALEATPDLLERLRSLGYLK